MSVLVRSWPRSPVANSLRSLPGYPPAAVQRTCHATMSWNDTISIQTGLFQMLYTNDIGCGSRVIGQQLEIPLNLSTRSATFPGVSAELSVDTACVLVVALEFRQTISSSSSSSSPMASAELCVMTVQVGFARRKKGNGLSSLVDKTTA